MACANSNLWKEKAILIDMNYIHSFFVAKMEIDFNYYMLQIMSSSRICKCAVVLPIFLVSKCNTNQDGF